MTKTLEYFGPGFSLMSPQQDIKFSMKNNKNTSAFQGKRRRKGAGMYKV